MDFETKGEEATYNQKSLMPLSFYAIMAIAFLAPIFFIPLPFVPFQFSKVMLVIVLTAIILAGFLVHSLRQGQVVIPYSLSHLSLLALPVAYFVSAIFSSQPALSFSGYQLEIDTFGFIFFSTLLTYLVAITLGHKARIFSVLLAFLFGALIVFIFQIIQIAFGAPFPFLADPSANLIGRWNDFGIFAGLVAALVLLTAESLPLPKRHYFFLVGTFLVALFALALVNLFEVWALFSLASFVMLVLSVFRYFITKERSTALPYPLVLPAFGFIVSIFFLFFGAGVSANLQQVFSIQTFEVRPTFQSTVNITSKVYENNLFFGSGPNTFDSQWLLYRSPEIVQTPFWNVSFSAGSGSILSSIATGGILIALAWAFFVGTVLLALGRALFLGGSHDPRSYLVTSLTALGTLYLLCIHVFYSPSQSITILLFLFLGLFLASISPSRLVKTSYIELKKAPRIGFAFVLAGILLILFSLSAVYIVGSKYASAYYHGQAIAFANQGEFEKGFQALNTAVRLDAQDRYYRTLALMNLAVLNGIVQSGDDSSEAQGAFQNALSGAIQSANTALQKNPRSFQNAMTRGLVFETVVPLQIEGSFENAVSVYEQARPLNPLDPEIDWRLAQMHAVRGDIEEARRFINNALSKKADYTDAILLLAQIEVDAGNLDEAIKTVRAAVFFEPQNSVFLYQLGILLLQNESYEEASGVLSEALRINPGFANASFFLAQAYAFLGHYEEAEGLMAMLEVQNPDNALVLEYRGLLGRGENPFDTAPVAPNEEEVIE